jgi:hypothetical protein
VLVNKHFYATAQLVAHRRKRLNYHPNGIQVTQKQIKKWLGEPLMLRNIREITITGDLYRNSHMIYAADKVAAMWAPLVELVRKAARLTKVNFDCGAAEFPLALLEALQTCHPHVKLCIWSYHRDEELDHTDAAEQALAVSPILRSIRTHIWTNGSGSDIDLRLSAFQRIVANAPHLKFASVTRGHSGCVVRGHSTESLARERQAAAKFMSSSRGPNTSIRSLTLDGFRLEKSTLNEWGKYVSLPHLESLKCSRGMPGNSYFEVAPTLLTHLKHVSLNLSTASHEQSDLGGLVENYLASCAPLETLSLWGWMGVVSLDTILKHGPTLKTLQLHERESLSLDMRRGLLTTKDLQRVREECHQLEDLTLDMDREDASWQKDLDRHQDILDELAQLGRRLRKIQIYLDLGVAQEVAGFGRQTRYLAGVDVQALDSDEEADNGPGKSANLNDQGPFPPPKRSEIKEHGQRVWKTIFGNPAQRGPRELDIKWGEYERKMGSGYPAPWVLWERRHVRHVVVRPQERDDRLGEAVVRVLGGYEDEDA